VKAVSELSCTSKLGPRILWNPVITCEWLSQTKSLATAWSLTKNKNKRAISYVWLSVNFVNLLYRYIRCNNIVLVLNNTWFQTRGTRNFYESSGGTSRDGFTHRSNRPWPKAPRFWGLRATIFSMTTQCQLKFCKTAQRHNLTIYVETGGNANVWSTLNSCQYSNNMTILCIWAWERFRPSVWKRLQK